MFKARYAFALTAITALATSAGCALDTEALGTDGHFLLEAGGNDDGTDGCPWDMCGGNFDIALGFAISTNGQPNHYGLSVVSVRMPGGAPGWLTISGSELAIWFNGQLATGDNVVGAELVLESEVTGGRFILQVVDWNADGVESWAFPGEYYSTYSFIWRHQGAPMSASLPLCGANPWAGPTSSAAPSTEAVILPHESYDWEGNPTNDLANDPLQGENWLSIACSGGALAKKKLMGYDLSFTAPGRVTTRGESHAVLAMLNARFCGTTSHTQAGVPLWWQNRREWYPAATANVTQIEAVWSHTGRAVCLNQPRLGSRGAAIAECPDVVPTCQGSGIDPRDYPITSYLVFE